MTTSLFVVPHPDDDVIRLTAVMIRNALRGDRCILLSVTSGGTANNARLKGWSSEFEKEYRAAEQASAFAFLTFSKGQVIRLRMMDKESTPDVVEDAIKGIMATTAARGDSLQVYVASHYNSNNNEYDQHNDHISAAQGAIAANPSYLRFAEEPVTGFTTPSERINVSATYMPHAESALRVYEGLERTPQNIIFNTLVANNYQTSLVTKP